MSVAGSVAPLQPAPLPPPLQHQGSLSQQQQQQQLQQLQPPPEPEEQPVTSRYRSLRGKSVSSPRLREELQIYQDDVAASSNGSPSARRRSKSLVAQRRGGTAPKAPPTFALTPKPINLPVAVKQKLSSVKSVPSNIYQQKSALASRLEFPAYHDENIVPVPPLKIRSRSSTRDSAKWAEEVARLEAETDRILAEQKKLDLARLQAQLAAAKSPPPRPKRLILGKLTFLSRSGKRSSPSPTSASGSVPGSRSPSTVAPTLFSFDLSSRDSTPVSSPSPQSMNFIEVGGKGIVPQMDAPTSASNGGERRVTVRCMSSTINLPVTNETSPVDIIYAAANFTTHQIDPASCILVECYVVFGLERRLRRYERVRDIMNSWDRDQQNTLLIMPLDDFEDTSNLDICSVRRSEEAPPGFTMHLYHSSRPGKWNKRWVTLMDNGQMFACKKADGKASDKESQAVAHLSDFDIYNPKESEMKRHLKPPKRFCYAIKSQQKTAVFSDNSENFVHFFSTDDAAVATRFNQMVHAWRSWYLVNKQVDLRKKDRVLPPSPQSTKKSAGVTRSATHKRKESVEEKPYMLGQFKPLMDMDPFDKPLEEFGKAFEEEARAVQEKIRAEQRQLAERQRSKTLTKQPQPHILQMPPTPKSPEEFSAGGLLGDGYEKRKQAIVSSTPTSPQQEGPFTDGPSLLQQAASKASTPDAAKPEPQSWFPSASEHTARARSHSMRSVRRPTTADPSRPPLPQGPLLNLTKEETRRPAPRVGNAVKPPTGAPLINFATGGQSANAFPDGPQRGVPRSHTGGRIGGPPPQAVGARPRSKSTSQQGTRRLVSAEERPPIPPLPHRSGRRDGMPHNGAPRSAVGSNEPLVNHAR